MKIDSITPFVLIVFLLSLLSLFHLPEVQAQGGGKAKPKGQNVTIQMTNRSSSPLTVLRGSTLGRGNSAGGNPGFRNKAGILPPGGTETVKSQRGQIWSFMLNDKLVTSITAENGQNLSIIVKQAQVNAIMGRPKGGNQPSKPQPTQPNKPQPKVPTVPAGVAGKTGSKVTAAEAQAVVNYHNQKRREVGNGPVKWSNKIAKYAQSRAETIARTKRFAHLPQGQNPYGENLAQKGATGGGAKYTSKDGAVDWYSEKKLMPNNARVMTSNLFNRGVGHYTQMVWKGSTEIGAGTATFQQNGFTMIVVVCCYNPPGNMLGDPIF